MLRGVFGFSLFKRSMRATDDGLGALSIAQLPDFSRGMMVRFLHFAESHAIDSCKAARTKLPCLSGTQAPESHSLRRTVSRLTVSPGPPPFLFFFSPPLFSLGLTGMVTQKEKKEKGETTTRVSLREASFRDRVECGLPGQAVQQSPPPGSFFFFFPIQLDPE
jgi:hypothetical protein